MLSSLEGNFVNRFDNKLNIQMIHMKIFSFSVVKHVKTSL